MSFVAVAVAGAAVVGGYMNYQAGQAQAENERQNAKHNQAMMAIKEREAKRIGENEAGKIRLKGEKIKGAQKAALAASGVVVNSGSALDIERETDALTMDDIDTTKTNAALEAWGFKTQGTNAILQGNFNASAAENQGKASLISSVGSAASSYSSIRSNK